MRATTAGRLTGVLRAGIGAAHLFAPASSSAPLTGEDAVTPGAEAYIRFFGVRDALLGAVVAAAGSDAELRRWVRWAAVVDAVDTLSVVAGLRRLPARRRWAALAVPGTAAVLGVLLGAALDRQSRTDPGACQVPEGGGEALWNLSRRR
ncbi:hypothetical protein AB0F72_13960 [Actinoplanes sp. NPDC023936]|uniref:hypothetical protein n=1 Tax=Actinoplanes sp. NPDC023936 TaxID=3154910 RepID=UPI0033EABDEF